MQLGDGQAEAGMDRFWGRWARARKALFRVAFVAVTGLWPVLAHAEDRATLHVTSESGYGRMVLTFPGRNDLPPYKVRYENGVLAVEFDEPISLLLPDVAIT